MPVVQRSEMVTVLDERTDLTVGNPFDDEDDSITLWHTSVIREEDRWITLSEQAEHRLLMTLLARKAARENA